MNNQILISDFVKLTGTTLKTVLYYHKIGLLKEAKRSDSGYRLYGADDLERMRKIKHLKNLGLDLNQIKETLGENENKKTLREVLQSLKDELLIEKNKIENRLVNIESILDKEVGELENTRFESKTFKSITETLDKEQLTAYKQSCPELFSRQQNTLGLIDDFKWKKDYTDNLNKLAEYFKEHPEKYKIAIEFGKRLSKVKDMSEDDPEIEKLAMESAEFIKNEPILKEMLYDQQGLGGSDEVLFNEISNKLLTKAQVKHKKLIQKYLNYRA